MEQLGRYRLLQELGSGGFATVYRAEATTPEGFRTVVALKRLHPHLTREDPVFIESLRKEAESCARIHHHNVVQVYEMASVQDAEGQDHHYMVMELVEGVPLEELPLMVAKRGEFLPLEVVVDLLIQIAEGLHHVHTLHDDDGNPMGMVHRDLKPSNVLVRRDGMAKILDFGIAKSLYDGGPKTATGITRGTAAYMSPEQAFGKQLSFAADQFSYGALLFFLIAGEHLVRAESMAAELLFVVNTPSGYRADEVESAFPGLGWIFERLREPRVEDRFPSMAEVIDALRQLQAAIQDPVETADYLERLLDDPAAHVTTTEMMRFRGLLEDDGPPTLTLNQLRSRRTAQLGRSDDTVTGGQMTPAEMLEAAPSATGDGPIARAEMIDGVPEDQVSAPPGDSSMRITAPGAPTVRDGLTYADGVVPPGDEPELSVDPDDPTTNEMAALPGGASGARAAGLSPPAPRGTPAPGASGAPAAPPTTPAGAVTPAAGAQAASTSPAARMHAGGAVSARTGAAAAGAPVTLPPRSRGPGLRVGLLSLLLVPALLGVVVLAAVLIVQPWRADDRGAVAGGGAAGVQIEDVEIDPLDPADPSEIVIEGDEPRVVAGGRAGDTRATRPSVPPPQPSRPLAVELPAEPTPDGGRDAPADGGVASADDDGEASASAPAEPAAPATGVLKLNAYPAADVYVDGRHVGTTLDTAQGVRLTVGSHRVKLVRTTDGYEQSLSVEILEKKVLNEPVRWNDR